MSFETSGVEMPMSHYTVGYHDSNRQHYEICEYAQDAYEAEYSKEDVPRIMGASSSFY